MLVLLVLLVLRLALLLVLRRHRRMLLLLRMVWLLPLHELLLEVSDGTRSCGLHIGRGLPARLFHPAADPLDEKV